MNKVYLHFKSDVKFNLFINGEYVDFCDNFYSLDIVMTSSKLNYMACPICSEKNYCINSGIIEILHNDLICETRNTKVINYGNCHFDIMFMSECVNNLSQNHTVSIKHIENVCVTVCNYMQGSISITYKGRCVESINLQSYINAVNIQQIEDKIIIEGVLDNSNRVVVILNMEGKKLYECECNSVEINGGKCKCLTEIKNMLGIAKVSEVDIATININEYNVYINKQSKITNPLTIPYAFLYSLQAKNYNIAKLYLGQSFVDVKDIQLQNYFGEIKEIYYNPYLMDEKIEYIVISDTTKSYEFIIENGFIVDIKQNNVKQ